MTTIFRSKFIWTALFAVLFSIPALAQDNAAPAAVTVPNATAPEHVALAKAYVAAVPVEAQIKAAVEQMAQQVAPEQRVLFKQIGDKSIDYTKLRTSAEQAVAETFTDDEIKAMTAYYASPAGQSAQAKMPIYEQKMYPVMSQVLQDFIKRLQENNVLPKNPVNAPVTTPAH